MVVHSLRNQAGSRLNIHAENFSLSSSSSSPASPFSLRILTLPPDIPLKRVIQHLSVDGDVPSDESVDYPYYTLLTRIITFSL